MWEFDILDDCNFGVPYLLRSKSIFDKIYWVGFQFKFSFLGKNFSSIQDILVLDCIYSVKYWAFFIFHHFIIELFFDLKILFLGLILVLVHF